MEIAGGMDLVSRVPSSPCIPKPRTQAWWVEGFTSVDITREQVVKAMCSVKILDQGSNCDTF